MAPRAASYRRRIESAERAGLLRTLAFKTLLRCNAHAAYEVLETRMGAERFKILFGGQIRQVVSMLLVSLLQQRSNANACSFSPSSAWITANSYDVLKRKEIGFS